MTADFAYEAEADIYRCPAGEALTYRYTTEEGRCRPGHPLIMQAGQVCFHHMILTGRDPGPGDDVGPFRSGC